MLALPSIAAAMFYRFALLAVLPFALIVAGCSDDDEPMLPPEPSLELVEMNPDTVTALGQPVTFRLRYQDGDGDLGHSDPNASNLYIRDPRLDITHAYRIQQLSPEEGIAIQGEVTVELTNIPLADDNASQEQVQFTIWAEDRAGNRSNELTTPSLTVIAE